MYLTKRQIRRAVLRVESGRPVITVDGHRLPLLPTSGATRAFNFSVANWVLKADVRQTFSELQRIRRIAHHYPEYLRLFPPTRFLSYGAWVAAIQQRLTLVSLQDARRLWGDEHVERERGFARMAIHDIGIGDVFLEDDDDLWNFSFASDGRIYIYDFGL